jgi:rod shape-determining protein MreD
VRAGPGAAAALAILVAVVLQAAVLSRLPLPGGPPNLVLVLVIAIGLAGGGSAGLAAGFGAGLLTDLLSDHPVGVLALCFGLAGLLAGLLDADVRRSVLLSVVVVAVLTGAVYLTYLGVMGLLGQPVADGVAGVLGTIAYDIVLTPFVVPLVMAVTRRFAPARRGL